MTDDGLGPINVTGRWVGFYRHRWEQLGTFPITAEIRQQGERITGEMYDQITDRSEVLDRLIEVCREGISDWHRRRLEAIVKRLGTEAVVVSSRLPETSDVEGTVNGDFVQFVKCYRGSVEMKLTADGVDVGSVERRGHKVHYSGNLDRELGCIVGRWVIRWRGLLGRLLPPKGWGTFELYRKS